MDHLYLSLIIVIYTKHDFYIYKTFVWVFKMKWQRYNTTTSILCFSLRETTIWILLFLNNIYKQNKTLIFWNNNRHYISHLKPRWTEQHIIVIVTCLEQTSSIIRLQTSGWCCFYVFSDFHCLSCILFSHTRLTVYVISSAHMPHKSHS